MGSLVGILEERFGRYDEKVLKQKEIYSMLEVQHFLLIKENNLQCEIKTPIILFFYSNEESDLDESEELGELLGVIYRRNPDIKIYSFDINLNSDLIKMLKDKYGVKEPLTVVINEETKVVNPGNINLVIIIPNTLLIIW